jgi:signal transduction histidine kinase
VEAVGGCLRISSLRGQGTQVTVELPTSPADEGSASRVPSGAESHRAKLASVSEN